MIKRETKDCETCRYHSGIICKWGKAKRLKVLLTPIGKRKECNLRRD
jgi:hypothetical protein